MTPELQVPDSWQWVVLDDVCIVNPSHPDRIPEEEELVSFVPMASVEAGTARMDSSNIRPWKDVRKGYTRFQNEDVLFAKITPCMENGKSALATGLTGGVGAGSTEFHVLRPDAIAPKLLLYFVLQESFRRDARAKMRGAAGQLRVTPDFMSTYPVPLPPLAEQRRIVAEIETQLTRLDAAVQALERAKANLKRYRAAVLNAACEGRLVPIEAELARAEGRKYESADALLARILKERRAKRESDQFAKMKVAGKRPKDENWKAKYVEPAPPKTDGLPLLPEGWMWATWQQVGFSQNGRAFPSTEYSQQGTKLLRPGNLAQQGRTEWNDANTRYLPDEWAQRFPDYVVGPRELVMNLTAQSLKDEFLGRICLTGPTDRCLLNQRIARLTPVVCPPEYILWLFKSKMFRRFVDDLNTGSLIQHMFTSQLSDFTLPLPPLAEQERIAAEVERRLSVANNLGSLLERSLKRAMQLRRSVLQLAFEGRLVAQDPTDESASVLLERIRKERASAGVNSAERPQRRSRVSAMKPPSQVRLEEATQP